MPPPLARGRQRGCDGLPDGRILVGVNPTSAFAIDVPDSLLRRVRSGDAAAFETIYRRFERPLFTLALRLLGDREEAHEVLQDSMLKVLDRLGEFRGESPFWGWLRQIAVNEALMRLRRRGRLDYSDAPPDPGCDDDSPTLPAAVAEAAVLGRALAQLPDLTRSVLWLYHGEGYTHEEIAELMARTPSFSKSQVSRGLRRLRELLNIAPEVQRA